MITKIYLIFGIVGIIVQVNSPHYMNIINAAVAYTYTRRLYQGTSSLP
jgi:hypothetical protein